MGSDPRCPGERVGEARVGFDAPMPSPLPDRPPSPPPQPCLLAPAGEKSCFFCLATELSELEKINTGFALTAVATTRLQPNTILETQFPLRP